jgi:hypothetical protein
MTEMLESGMQFSCFVVHDEPWCVWEWDLSQRNLEFIEDLAPDYFEHLAGIHFQAAEGEQGLLAAVAIRLGYGQALEAFFALIFAALQAPDCVAGWLNRYKIQQLRSLVDAVSARVPILTKVNLPTSSWDAVANTLLSFKLPDEQRDGEVKKAISRLWSRFAHDFADAQQSQEYNAIKHGLRVRPGGFTLRSGREETLGVSPPTEQMETVAASRFGCSMLLPEPVGAEKHHFRLRRTSRNWDVENLTHGLVLLSESMKNVLSFLRIANGVDPTTVPFSWPQDLAELRQPWLRSVGFTSWNMDYVIRPEDIVAFSREDILRIYRPTADEDGA